MNETGKKMVLCIYASEASAVAGLHRFKHAVEVFENIFKREHKRQYEHLMKMLMEKYKCSTQQFLPLDVLVHQSIEQNQSLRHTLNTLKQKIQEQEMPLETIVQEAEMTITQNVNISSKSKEHRTTPQEPVEIGRQEVMSVIKSELSQEYGKVQERNSLIDLKNISHNNDKCYTKTLDSQNIIFAGRIDGLRHGTQLVEIKNRKSRFMHPIPEYEICQLHVYMHLLDKTEGILIEHLRKSSEDLVVKETKIKWDPKFWKYFQERIIDFARFYKIFEKDSQLQEEFFLLPNLDQKRTWFDHQVEPVFNFQ